MSDYRDTRAHALRDRWLATFGGDEIPVPVEAIAEDLLGLRIEERWDMEFDCSGKLLPAERLILLNAAELRERTLDNRYSAPLRRGRWTVAHEIGHWVCHATGAAAPQATYCRAPGVPRDQPKHPDEREADIFAAELLMPEHAVRAVWAERHRLARDLPWNMQVAPTRGRRDVSRGEAHRTASSSEGELSLDDAVAVMSHRFDVSPTAMHWRLYSYELVSEGPSFAAAGTRD